MSCRKVLRGHAAWLLLIAAAVSVQPALAKVVYVSKTGNDANNGLTWASAKLTVQAGLTTAVSDDQVWVAAGTYVENITLKLGVALYGGFAGGETDLAERSRVTNKTILDGNQAGSVVTSPASASDTTRVAGFTIRNGNAPHGGGVCCDSSSPAIVDNTITGNIASSDGGGIYCRYSSPIVANNTIVDNSADSNGGGICCAEGASPTVNNNTIKGNVADSGGAISCYELAPVIANNMITANSAYSYGGGIDCHYSAPMIANNTIMGNSADVGGGIHCFSYSSATVVNTIMAFNSSGIYAIGPNTLGLRHNCVYGNNDYDYFGVADPTGLDGNISVDPKLASIAYGNAHLQADSPCVNAGDNAVVQPIWLDIDAEARIWGDRVDIGADESDGTVWTTGPYAIVRVSPNGDDANDGLSWVAPKRTVQAAVDAAASVGGEVWVRSGIYFERIALLPYTYVYGGFAGTENAKEERDYATYPATLDGEEGGSVVMVYAGHQVSRIDGFIIRNGTGRPSNPYRYGGGIYCESSSPTIANNIITGNAASEGGGIYCLGGSCSPVIANNAITRNTASDRGAGIACRYGSHPVIANNVITANGAAWTGGGIHSDSAYPRIINNTITGNSASGGGGAVYCHLYNASLTVSNTIVAFNSSGIYNAGGNDPFLRYNCVFGNETYNYSGVTDPTGTDGNISVDPKLAGAAYGNVHIQADSPCRNAGDNAVVDSGWLEIDGRPRIIDSQVDIGADESDGAAWPGGPHVIVRVSANGDDANDGSSWPAAKRTVQAGIDVAASIGGEVWVQAGENYERITLYPFVYLYGGFAGTETSRSERDWNTNLSILDGQRGGSVVIIRAGYRLSTIDGFVIRNGIGTASGAYRYGGGIFCQYSSPTISNNTITGNTASGTYGYGGGIDCQYSSPAIIGNKITGNSAAGRGGGINCEEPSSPMIVGNMITGNIASRDGGGLYCGWFCSSRIVNNAVTENIASRKGGGIYCACSSPTITQNTIAGNSASVAGGAIYCEYSSPMIANMIVAFNSSGIFREGSDSPTLRYNCVFGNTAYNYSGITEPTGTNGNISADPLFVRPTNPGPDGQWGTPDDDYGDLRLWPSSPCIDAGDNGAVPADVLDLDGDGNTTEPMPFDIAGLSRFVDDPLVVDTGLGTPPIVDMGAYEYSDAVAPTLLSAVSRKSYGSAGDFDVDLSPGAPTSGVECRSGGPTKVVLTFSEPVSVVDGTPDATEVGLSAGVLGAVTIFGPQMTVNMSGVPDMTCLVMTLSGITDLAGNPLAPDSSTVRIRALLGDTNATGAVSVADVNQTRSLSGQIVDANNFRSDTNCSGAISVADVNQVRSRSGNSVTCQ